MPDSPLFSKMDADRILHRAAQIEGTEATPLSIEEVRSIAGEAGFGPRAVNRAIAEVLHAGPTEPGSHRVERSGFVVTSLSTFRSLPIELSSDHLIRAVRLFQPYREGPARVNLEERRITWRDRKGLKFTVVSAGGVTEIRVFTSKPLIRKGRWMGWVKAAADQLEALVYLVAARHPSEVASLDGRLLESGVEADGS